MPAIYSTALICFNAHVMHFLPVNFGIKCFLQFKLTILLLSLTFWYIDALPLSENTLDHPSFLTPPAAFDILKEHN